MKKWPIALQVYTVRDAAEADFAGTMRKVKEMGYDGVELAGTYGETAAARKATLDEIGLELACAYAAFGKVIEGMENVNKIAECRTDFSDRPLEKQMIQSMTVETFGEEYPQPEKM